MRTLKPKPRELFDAAQAVAVLANKVEMMRGNYAFTSSDIVAARADLSRAIDRWKTVMRKRDRAAKAEMDRILK